MFSLEKKVLWADGMHVFPQHYQQQERFLESQLNAKTSLAPWQWGFLSLSINEGLLSTGKLSISNASGIFEDGTPFDFPNSHSAPDAIDLPRGKHDFKVYLGLPLKQNDRLDVNMYEEPNLVVRQDISEIEVSDVITDINEKAVMQVGNPKLVLLTDFDAINDFVVLELCFVSSSDANGVATFEKSFIPPILDIKVSTLLVDFSNELLGLIKQQTNSLSGQFEQTTGSASEVVNMMRLISLNRALSVLPHLISMQPLHPESLYRFLRSFSAEACTLNMLTQPLPDFGEYLHRDLSVSFSVVIKELRKHLSQLDIPDAQAIILDEPRYGIRKASVNDKSLYQDTDFVVAIKAELPTEELRSRFLSQSTIGSVENIKDLINYSLPGIPMISVQTVPAGIPLQRGFHYFKLESKTEHWPDTSTSAGFALHIDNIETMPNLSLEFWAVRTPTKA